MQGKQIIVVFGATGAQGGSVAKSLLDDGKWEVKFVTRDPHSKQAQRLCERGAKIFEGDQQNLELLKEVFKGAYGTFALTDYWDKTAQDKEHELGSNLAREAKAAGVKHFVWSTLPDVEKYSDGKWKVPHFTDKAKVDEIIRGLNFESSTFVMPGFYYENFATFFAPQKVKEGNTEVLEFTLPINPEAYLSAFDVHDLGEVVRTVFAEKDRWNKAVIPVAGSHMKACEYIEIFKKVTGKNARLKSVSIEEYSRCPVPKAEEMAHMFGWIQEFNYFGPHLKDNLELAKQLHPKIKSWENWLRESHWTGEKTSQIGA